MVTKLNSMSFMGLQVIPIEIEVDIQARVPEFEIVGMAGISVKESVKRIETAIQNSGYHFPGKRLIVNLAPAGIKKMGTLFDLPIALGILAEQYGYTGLSDFVIAGELALDGTIRNIPGALPIAVQAAKLGYKKVMCPSKNANEAAIVDSIEVIPVSHLKEAVEYFCGFTSIEACTSTLGPDKTELPENGVSDMEDIKGQHAAKRAIEIAAAGAHNALMIGPPGTGKTMLARRIPGILPPLSLPEALETTMIYSIAGQVDAENPLIRKRPFRMPHHTSSDAAVIGGGRFPKPGEVSLAHNGVLFMDELQQFRTNVIQVLRQPMEDDKITISRAEGIVEFPAGFMLVAALNPSRMNSDIDRWNAEDMKTLLTRLSGPLLDRIDIHIQVSRVPYEQLKNKVKGESSKIIRERVQKARDIQAKRFEGQGVITNSRMSHHLVEKYCEVSPSAQNLLRMSMEKFMLSIRVYDKILKIARTIADLEGEDKIEDYHVSEALQYRVMDRLISVFS